MKKLILILLLTAFNSFAQRPSGKTILISDIDDTIKVAHIRSKLGTVKNAFRTRNIFLGMADLYKAIEARLGAKIYYLTNAPEKIMRKSHSALLRNGHFPQALNLAIRPSGVSTKVFKAQKLRQLIDDHNPTRVILIGDNGEHDNTFYHDVGQEYPEIEFHTYIRAVYNFDQNNELYENQESFISPFEIADSLYQRRIIKGADSRNLLAAHLNAYLSEVDLEDSGMLYTPEWQECFGHRPKAWTPKTTMPFSLIYRIHKLCQAN